MRLRTHTCIRGAMGGLVSMETLISVVVLDEFVKVDGSCGRPWDGTSERGARVLMPCTLPGVGPGEGVMSGGICHRTLVLYWYRP